MSFAQSDPRLALPPIDAPEPERLAPHQVYDFSDEATVHVEPSKRTWYGCGKTFVISYSEVEPGATIERENELDEHLVVLHDAGDVEIVANGETANAKGRVLIILPPGKSRLTFNTAGRVICVSTARSAPDLVALCNADPTMMNDPNVPEYAPAGAPFDGYKIRIYDFDSEPMPGAYAAVWRCSSFLVLRGSWKKGQRDTSMMSPHSHVNFQQSNLVLEGEYRANLRWPWVRNKAEWRKDEQVDIKAPGLLITPAQTTHTIEHRADGLNHCVDFYAPPRPDFAALGWALNDAEYPRPPMQAVEKSADATDTAVAA